MQILIPSSPSISPHGEVTCHVVYGTACGFLPQRMQAHKNNGKHSAPNYSASRIAVSVFILPLKFKIELEARSVY